MSREIKMEAGRPFRSYCNNPDQRIGGFNLGGSDRHDIIRNVGFRIYSGGFVMNLLRK